MSETTSNPIAEAVASMDAADSPHQDSAPQAETAQEQAVTTEAPATSEPDQSDDPTDAAETHSRRDRRIQQLANERREAREEAAYWRGLAEQRQQPPPQQQPEQQAPKGPQPLAPDLLEMVGPPPDKNAYPAGEFDPAYEADRDAYLDRRADARAEMRIRARDEVNQRQRNAQAFNAKLTGIIDAGSKKYTDFAEKALSQEVPMTEPMVAALARTNGAEDVAYFLGSNPEEARRIARLSADRVAVALEIGLIRGRLAQQAEAPAPIPQPSAAPPPPPKAVRGASAAGFDWSKASPAEIQARINAR